jgi:hypothetical protein
MLERYQLDELGILGGRLWFTVRGQDAEFELLTNQRAIPDRGPARLAPGEVYVEGSNEWRDARGVEHSERTWITTRRYPKGSFANGGKAASAPVKAKRTKPLKSVDGLAALDALAPRQTDIVSWAPERAERIEPLPIGVDAASVILPKVPRRVGAIMRAGRKPVRGVPAIIDLLSRQGIVLSPDAYRCHLDVQAPGGALVQPGRELIREALPLLAAALGATATPPTVDGRLTCHSVAHRGGTAPEAVSLGAGQMPLCGECLA